MFENQYKKAMDEITPSQEALDKARAAIKNTKREKRNPNHIIRIAAVACLSVTLICTTVFAVFNASYNRENMYDDMHSEINTDYISNASVTAELRPGESYEEICRIIDKVHRNYLVLTPDKNLDSPEYADEITGVGANSAPSNENNSERSDTNNQVEGVQEADIIKNDGEYIFFCDTSKNILNIIRTDNGDIDLSASLSLSGEYIHEMLLIDNMLAVISSEYYKTDDISQEQTVCTYYDISDKSSPKELRDMCQDGIYESSRAIGNTVYIVSTKHPYRHDDPMICIPKVSDELIEPGSILISDSPDSSAFTIITSYNASSDSEKHQSSLAVIGSADAVYSAKENIYITHSISNNIEDSDISVYNTYIYRISLNESELKSTGTGCIPGVVSNQFWMDEKDGKLRVATNIDYYNITKEKNTITNIINNEFNRIYCLDNSLEIIGVSEDLGVNENIKAVRYIGDIAYIVTFRQTDPLYAVDLCDETNPKTLSELKINGFSTYMHSYGNGLLLGLGYEADPSTGITTGLKLTMFDISDPASIKDITTYSYMWGSNSHFDSEAMYNHKAILIDAKKHVIAIPLTVVKPVENEYGNYNHINETYFVFFEFDGDSLIEKQKILVNKDSTDNVRALYIKDYGYIIDGNIAVSISLDKFETVATTILD